MTIELAVQVIISLGAVIAALVGVIKFYLPQHDRRLHNPWAEELLGEMRQMRQENSLRHTETKAILEELRRSLERMERQ